MQLRVVGHVSDIIFLEEIITLHYNFLQNERKVKIFFFLSQRRLYFMRTVLTVFLKPFSQNSLLMCEKVEILRQ